MTSMARRVLIRVAEVAVDLVSALTSSRVEAEDSASNRPTTYLDNSLAAKIPLLTSSAMIHSQRSVVVAVVRRNNQINKGEEDSKPLVAWVEASSTMTTSSVGASGAASEVGQCSSRCSRLAVEAADSNQSRSRALVAWVAAWANLCHNRPTSRMESVSLAPKPRQLMLKATDKLTSKRKQMMVVETSQ